MKTCEVCAYWNNDVVKKDEIKESFGFCKKLRDFGQYCFNRIDGVEFETVDIISSDGDSGGVSGVFTNKYFGCIHHQMRNEK